MHITSNGIRLKIEQRGPEQGPALVLIRGLGTQMVHWPEELLDGFAALGFRVIIFDNRDVGLSQRCPKAGVPDDAQTILEIVRAGKSPQVAYTLDDMALDVIGLLDSLKIAKAHIFGISMGGGIAQILATHHSSRCHSVTIVMSAARFASGELLEKLLAWPATKEEFVNSALEGETNWGSPGFPMGDAEIRTMAQRAYDRGFDAKGINRQVLATSKSGDRSEKLKGVDLPCCVIHGTHDTLIPPQAGEEIAALIPHSKHHQIDGMGHTITPKLAPLIVDKVAAFIRNNSQRQT